MLSAALNVKIQLKQILFRQLLDSPPRSKRFSTLTAQMRVKIAFLSGFYQNVAHLQPNGTYSIVFNRDSTVLIHPSSVVRTKPEFVSYVEYILTAKDFIRTVSEINIEWLLDLHPGLFKTANLELMNEFTRSRIQRAQSKVKQQS